MLLLCQTKCYWYFNRIGFNYLKFVCFSGFFLNYLNPWNWWNIEKLVSLSWAFSKCCVCFKQLQEHSNGAQSEGLQMLTDAIQECSSEMASLLQDKLSTNHYTEIKDLIRQNQQILTTNQQMLKSLMVPKWPIVNDIVILSLPCNL